MTNIIIFFENFDFKDKIKILTLSQLVATSQMVYHMS